MTVLCPSQAVIFGWIWKAGTLTPSSHKTAPLSSVEHPTTCSSMRSFIDAFKAVSKCIPQCASLVAPLEDSIGGLQDPQAIIWTPDLSEHFRHCQETLRSPKTITIPIPNDKLILTVDASPINRGLGATLFLVRNSTKHIAVGSHVNMKV